jgi:hypothetical protein
MGEGVMGISEVKEVEEAKEVKDKTRLSNFARTIFPFLNFL